MGADLGLERGFAPVGYFCMAPVGVCLAGSRRVVARVRGMGWGLCLQQLVFSPFDAVQ